MNAKIFTISANLILSQRHDTICRSIPYKLYNIVIREFMTPVFRQAKLTAICKCKTTLFMVCITNASIECIRIIKQGFRLSNRLRG